MSAASRPRPTLDEIREWPATIEVRQAARALGVSASQLYLLIGRGEAPVRVLPLGARRVVVVTSSLVRALSEEDAA